ncbi:MAG: ABC transporter permease [Deltaproteobacteria bacterium]|nr:ABC transporter permease [Deltaproteobacteria bacterium]
MRGIEETSGDGSPVPVGAGGERGQTSRITGRLAFTGAYTVCALASWEILVRGLAIPDYLLPGPWAVFQVVAGRFGLLASHAVVTVQEIVLGFALGAGLGAALAVVVSLVAALRMVLLPTLVALQSIPKVALAPLMVVWLGIGPAPIVAMAALFSFFPVFINTLSGLTKVEPAMVELAQVLRATPWRRFRKIALPYSLPFLFDGMKIAMPLSIVGAVVGEFTSGGRGLGNLILVASSQVNTPLIFASLVAITVVALLLFGAVQVLERLVIPWSVQFRKG